MGLFLFFIITSLLCFLDYMHKWHHTVCLSPSYFTKHKTLHIYLLFLQMIKFHSFVWLNSILLYIYTVSSLSIHLLINRLLPYSDYCKIMLLWILGCMCLFKLVFSFFSDIYTQEWNCQFICTSIFSVWRNFHIVFHNACTIWPHLFIFAFVSIAFEDRSSLKNIAIIYVKECSAHVLF